MDGTPHSWWHRSIFYPQPLPCPARDAPHAPCTRPGPSTRPNQTASQPASFVTQVQVKNKTQRSRRIGFYFFKKETFQHLFSLRPFCPWRSFEWIAVRSHTSDYKDLNWKMSSAFSCGNTRCTRCTAPCTCRSRSSAIWPIYPIRRRPLSPLWTPGFVVLFDLPSIGPELISVISTR